MGIGLGLQLYRLVYDMIDIGLDESRYGHCTTLLITVPVAHQGTVMLSVIPVCRIQSNSSIIILALLTVCWWQENRNTSHAANISLFHTDVNFRKSVCQGRSQKFVVGWYNSFWGGIKL